MVHKIRKSEMLPDLNKSFIELIENNINNKKQSVIFLNNNTPINLNSRGMSVKYYDDILRIYRNDELKYIIDVNSIICVMTK